MISPLLIFISPSIAPTLNPSAKAWSSVSSCAVNNISLSAIVNEATACTFVVNKTPSSSTASGAGIVIPGAVLKFFRDGPDTLIFAILLALGFAGTVANNWLNPAPLLVILIASKSNSPSDVKPIVATGVVVEPGPVPENATFKLEPL